MMLVTIMLSTMLWGDNRFSNFVRVILPIGVLIGGIYLTHSRGALVALAVTLAVALRRKLKLWGSAVFAVLFAGGLFAARFTGGREISMESGADRLSLWSEGLNLLKGSHFLGIGYRNFADEIGMTAHNSILLVATETGLLGLLLFLAVISISFLQLRNLYSMVKLSAPQHGLAERVVDGEVLRELRACELALTAFLASSWFLSRAYHPLPYLLVGLTAALVAEQGDLHPDWELSPRWTTWLWTSVAASVGAIALVYLMVRLRAV
jgi:O-antigen ligase